MEASDAVIEAMADLHCEIVYDRHGTSLPHPPKGGVIYEKMREQAREMLRAAFDRALELARDGDVKRHPMSVSEEAWGLLHSAAYGGTDE